MPAGNGKGPFLHHGAPLAHLSVKKALGFFVCRLEAVLNLSNAKGVTPKARLTRRALFAEGLLPCEFDYGEHVAEAAFAAKGAACALAPCKGIKQGRNGRAHGADLGRTILAFTVSLAR